MREERGLGSYVECAPVSLLPKSRARVGGYRIVLGA